MLSPFSTVLSVHPFLDGQAPVSLSHRILARLSSVLSPCPCAAASGQICQPRIHHSYRGYRFQYGTTTTTTTTNNNINSSTRHFVDNFGAASRIKRNAKQVPNGSTWDHPPVMKGGKVGGNKLLEARTHACDCEGYCGSLQMMTDPTRPWRCVTQFRHG